MGILDEAIREHLDLKRRHGAAESELKQLEDEAFGPPTRPGEPDFPERPPENGDVLEPETALAEMDEAVPFEGEAPEPPSEGEPVAEAEAATTLMPSAPADESAELPPDLEREPEVEVEAAPESAPAAAIPQPVEDVGDAGTTDEAPALDLEELDLELDEDLGDLGEPEGEQGDAAASAEPTAPGEAPIESLETVEYAIEEAPSEEHVVEEGEAEAHGEEARDEEAPDEGEEERGDVLEETPEFLRDHPDDDELWFEQGQPKDFDF